MNQQQSVSRKHITVWLCLYIGTEKFVYSLFGLTILLLIWPPSLRSQCYGASFSSITQITFTRYSPLFSSYQNIDLIWSDFLPISGLIHSTSGHFHWLNLHPHTMYHVVRNLLILKPIFDRELRSRWLTIANAIDTNNLKSTWPT